LKFFIHYESIPGTVKAFDKKYKHKNDKDNGMYNYLTRARFYI